MLCILYYHTETVSTCFELCKEGETDIDRGKGKGTRTSDRQTVHQTVCGVRRECVPIVTYKLTFKMFGFGFSNVERLWAGLNWCAKSETF